MTQKQFIYLDREDDDYVGVVYARTEKEADSIMEQWHVDSLGYSKKMAKQYVNENLKLVEACEINTRTCDSCSQKEASISLCKEC